MRKKVNSLEKILLTRYSKDFMIVSNERANISRRMMTLLTDPKFVHLIKREAACLKEIDARFKK